MQRHRHEMLKKASPLRTSRISAVIDEPSSTLAGNNLHRLAVVCYFHVLSMSNDPKEHKAGCISGLSIYYLG